MAHLDSIKVFFSADEGYAIGEPGELTKDRLMPIGNGLANLLAQNEGRFVVPIQIVIDGVEHTIPGSEGDPLDDENGPAIAQSLVRFLAPFTKRRRIRGNPNPQ